MLSFATIEIKDKAVITPYLNRYGALSCQHSMTLFTGLSMKYGDEYAIVNGILFIHRSKLDEDGKRVYLAPLCESEKYIEGVDAILTDASSYNCKVVFNTVTDEFKSFLNDNYPDRFEFEYSRDYAEYIYETENLSILPGRPLAPKRNRVRAFYSAYEGHIDIQNITRDNISDVAAFQEYWIKDRLSEEYDEMLARENEAIKFYLAHYDELEFKGIVVYVKGTVVGYAAGAALSDDCMDEVIEKGRKDVTGIYQLLCNEFAIICAKGYKYINREEDLGVEGLRRAKESYCPDIMLEKYVVTEI